MTTTTCTGLSPGTQRSPAIEIRGLVKTFLPPRGTRTPIEAVQGVDLRIERGEVVALLGPNGAGKTTLLDMVLGLTRPTSGTVTVLGGTPGQAITTGRISSVMQDGGLLPRLTVGQTLGMVADIHGRLEAVEAVAARARIDSILGRRVRTCSGGERQRLRFALALLPDPDLLVLDEPTNGLDVSARRDFWAAIRADAAAGRTVVFATHYLAEADDIADRVILMAGGKVVADDTPTNVKGCALGRVVEAKLPRPTGDDALRALPGVTDVERRGDTVRIHTRDSDTLARHLFTATDARDIEITSRGLGEAFVTLTEGSPA
ncbi:ABC transporter ATP-binding protein [Gephyromycinifex aptenodytis]|uniref:ABC transporter ATP-binding protein n=1 Tax=Gephyromycinifex aptenodytis TaxID=2716227 RepID=UPI00144563BF|nr:ABC transporter ATP-binding protein [Gephyromycinifex aptenodytis]